MPADRALGVQQRDVVLQPDQPPLVGELPAPGAFGAVFGQEQCSLLVGIVLPVRLLAGYTLGDLRPFRNGSKVLDQFFLFTCSNRSKTMDDL